MGFPGIFTSFNGISRDFYFSLWDFQGFLL